MISHQLTFFRLQEECLCVIIITFYNLNILFSIMTIQPTNLKQSANNYNNFHLIFTFSSLFIVNLQIINQFSFSFLSMNVCENVLGNNKSSSMRLLPRLFPSVRSFTAVLPWATNPVTFIIIDGGMFTLLVMTSNSIQ